MLVVLLASGCISDPNCINGSGNVVSETRTADTFHSVEMECSGNLYVTQTWESGVRVETDDNIMPLLKTDVINGVLIIKRGGTRCLSPTKLNIYVSMDDVKRLSLSGSGNIIGRSEITSDDLEVSLSGSGDIDLQVDTKRLKSEISGSGESKFTGKASSHDATISGSGDLKAYDLVTEKSTVQVTGSGKSEVFASEELNVKITGSGDVYYKGNPATVNKKILGSGELKKAD